MKSSTSRPRIEEARRLLFASSAHDALSFELMTAADVLMRACEDPEKVSFGDMLRCLEIPGVVSEMDARSLYVRTGRDGVGWKPATAGGLPFSTSKEDWMRYLRARDLIAHESKA
jgi:hypothetical protein